MLHTHTHSKQHTKLYPDLEIKDTAVLSPTKLLKHSNTSQKQACKASNQRCRNKHKESHKVKRQRSISKLKGKEESPEKELNVIEASDLSDTELKIMVIRMLKELSEDYSEIYGNYKEFTGNYSSMKDDIMTMNKD